jgi:hypothetical protein
MKLVEKGVHFQLSTRVGVIEEGIKLWREYVDQAFKFTGQNQIRCMHIKYEELLARPAEILPEVAKFLKLNVNKNRIESCIQSIDAGRQYAFVKDAELVDIYRSIESDCLVRKLGYDAIPISGL